MRFLRVGAGVLLLCLLACAASLGALGRLTERTAAALEQARCFGESGSYAEAAGWVERAARGWEESKGFLGSTLRHAELDEIETGFRALKVRAEQGEAGDFLPACAEQIARIAHLAESERPYYYNIL